MLQRVPRWEADYAEFVAAHATRLRRQAYLRCGDWTVADQVLGRVLRDLYRRWPDLGNEPPEEFVARRLHRVRPVATAVTHENDPAPVPAVEMGALVVGERRRRTRVRLAGATLTMVTLVAAVGGLALLYPGPGGGGPPPEFTDCMAEMPRSALPRSADPIATSGSPVPVQGDRAGVPPVGGVDRLVTVADLLPLPGAAALPADVAASRSERMACALADLITRLITPLAVERVELGLGYADVRPLWPQADPAYGTALTTSVLIMTPSGISTATVTVAQTSHLPALSHCKRLAACLTSSVGPDGQIIEEYHAYDTRTGAAGFELGAESSWMAMLVYTGHTLISVTVTNTPDVRAALPATQLSSPLSPQLVVYAGDPRLALFDPSG